MHWKSRGLHSNIETLALICIFVLLWLLTRGYHGLTGDAQIYAFQALAKLLPALSDDLYLQNVSQDRYTLFSPLYAWFISILGLENAARVMTISCTAWLLAASWALARTLASGKTAALSIVALLIVTGTYGGSGVFSFCERSLTARLPAEALVITAIVCHLNGKKLIGALLAGVGLLIHPLMALPGLLLLICLSLPRYMSVLAVLLGMLGTFAIATLAVRSPVIGSHFQVMDAAWISIVRERSQFLFLQLWSVRDWDTNVRPFLYLGFATLVTRDKKIIRLCFASMLVGAAGLGMGLIASLTGPVALFVQGQAWRWVWVGGFVSALLLPYTVLRLLEDKTSGRLAALLLILSWTWAVADASACVSLAMFLWIIRTHISPRWSFYVFWATAALATAVTVSTAHDCYAIFATWTASTERSTSAVELIREVFRLRVVAAFVVLATWQLLRTSRSATIPAALCAFFIIASALVLPAALKQAHTFKSVPDSARFANWINAIPPTSTVLVTPARDVGGFVWFTLTRPNYLAVDQSAGVVFSRATALEVSRRSDVLVPVMDPNWRVMSALDTTSNGKRTRTNTTRPLSAESLSKVCSDPGLGFVISPQTTGFDSIRHSQADAWKDWNLYDCARVRSMPASPT